MPRSSQLANQINIWIKSNAEELETNPLKTLNHPELLDLFQQAQRIDEIICSIDPVYKECFMPPKELHRHMLEVAQGMHKQTH